MSTHRTTITDENDDEINVIVHYTAVPFIAGSRDGRHGLKLEPDEPAHFEDFWVEGPDGTEIKVTERQQDHLEEEVGEYEYEQSLPPEIE